MAPYTLAVAALLGLAAAQSLGTASKEVHPKLTTWKCTKARGCKSQSTALVLDSATHSIHQKNDTTKKCGNWGSGPDAAACPDEATCAKNCVIEGISNYADYGVTTKGGAVTMKMFGKKGVASPRIYLLAADKQKYEMIKLTGQEFTFDVDVSKLPCGMNGALYMSEMEAAGGKSALNPGGAAYGTGYCDAQCFVTPWLNGVGNIGKKGACCNELDIWEANKVATQVAPHVCSKDGIYGCTGEECTKTGVCDKNGCGKNPYTTDKSYYKPGGKVDTSKPFTVVTQFPASNGTLQSVIRKYVQNGKVIEDAASTIPMDDAYCTKNGATDYMRLGGMKGMGGAMSRGMVLAMSIWWDEGGFMNWLDSGNAGPCNATEGDPKVIRQVEKAPSVVFSQIKWGEIGSTFSGKKNNRWDRE
ncbi:glycoside hydrolase [Bimuria novae-zelandiae CBS 107.79]|uniref:Glucanase n=1 Tax=Bimuria novae-zelandiae CBS 107.79 TaxID=1447943 RepID=A0A6A5V975_9PLEO|nr:glycoside hydrolase [Bimuria novae-zelandiae CBS 107.79]